MRHFLVNNLSFYAHCGRNLLCKSSLALEIWNLNHGALIPIIDNILQTSANYSKVFANQLVMCTK